METSNMSGSRSVLLPEIKPAPKEDKSIVQKI